MPADPRTDVYGFGITAYYMLTGVLPFNGPEVHDFVTQHTEKKPPSLRGKVPDELAELVERCLEKEPSRRPADGAALVSILSPVMPVMMEDILPPTVMSAAVPTFKPPRQRRNPLPVLAVLLSLVVGAAAFLAVEQPWKPSAQARLLLRAGQPGLALERLDHEDAPAVRALVLEALGKQDELTTLLKERCVAVVSGLSPADRERLKVSFARCAQ